MVCELLNSTSVCKNSAPCIFLKLRTYDSSPTVSNKELTPSLAVCTFFKRLIVFTVLESEINEELI